MNEYSEPLSPSELLENETERKAIAERPAYIKENHWREWVEHSKVDPLLTALNVRSLSGTTPHEYLLYGLPDSERRNDRRLRDKWLYTYQHLEHGGWWCSGLNLLKKEESEWGCFKPNQPRKNKKDKPIKYEHPPKVPTEAFFLKVTWQVGLKIATNCGLEANYKERIVDLIGIASTETFLGTEDLEFWQWVIENPEIVLVIGVRGAKLSQSAK